MIKEFDKIRLKTGRRGRILEIFSDNTFLAEVVKENGDVEIDEIERDAIKAIIVEVEQAVS